MTDGARDTGWAYPTDSARKAHFFDEGRSLCGAWAYLGREWLRVCAAECCKGCKRRLS